MESISIPLLSLLIFFPFASAIFLALMPADDRWIWRMAFILTLGEFAYSLKMLWLFDPSVGMLQLYEFKEWIRPFGITYFLAVDGISLWLVILTTALTPVVVLSAWSSIQRQMRAYLVSLLLLEGAMVGSFLALDLILFFVFWELMLIPMAILIGVWGGARRIYSAIKFFLYTALGSGLMLVSIMALAYLNYARTGTLTFNYVALQDLIVPSHLAVYLFMGFAIAFAIKVPIVPFHTWLPDAHTEAPTGGSVILAGVLLKFGVYGYFRFCLPFFPDISIDAAPWFAVLGMIGVVYGALVSLVQTDMKRLVAYSSVSHLGFCVLGIFSLTVEGMAGSLYVCLAHGVTTGALFLLVGFLYDRRHTRLISDFGGLTQSMPCYAAFFVFTALASAGLPGLCGFIGEFLSLSGVFLSNLPAARLLAGGAASAVILSAIYLLWMVQRVFFGELTHEKNRLLSDLTPREKCSILPLLALMLWMGVYPEPILSRLRPSVESLRTFVILKTQQIDIEKQRRLTEPQIVPVPAPDRPDRSSQAAV